MPILCLPLQLDEGHYYSHFTDNSLREVIHVRYSKGEWHNKFALERSRSQLCRGLGVQRWYIASEDESFNKGGVEGLEQLFWNFSAAHISITWKPCETTGCWALTPEFLDSAGLAGTQEFETLTSSKLMLLLLIEGSHFKLNGLSVFKLNGLKNYFSNLSDIWTTFSEIHY